MVGSNPDLESVRLPPEKRRKIYMARCPQCGEGPYLRDVDGRTVCSDLCEATIARKKEVEILRRKQNFQRVRIRIPTKAEKKSLKEQIRIEKKQRRMNDHINRTVEDRVKKAMAAIRKTPAPAYGPSFYTSSPWRDIRYHAIKRSRGCCEACGRKRGHGVVLHVDHIKPRSKYPHLELVIDNLQVLCEDCNMGKSNRDDTDWRK